MGSGGGQFLEPVPVDLDEPRLGVVDVDAVVMCMALARQPCLPTTESASTTVLFREEDEASQKGLEGRMPTDPPTGDDTCSAGAVAARQSLIKKARELDQLCCPEGRGPRLDRPPLVGKIHHGETIAGHLQGKPG